MYSKIVNPETGRKVNIDSKLGQTILKKYLDNIKGGNGSAKQKSKKARAQNSQKRGRENAQLRLKIIGAILAAMTLGAEAAGVANRINQGGPEARQGKKSVDMGVQDVEIGDAIFGDGMVVEEHLLSPDELAFLQGEVDSPQLNGSNKVKLLNEIPRNQVKGILDKAPMAALNQINQELVTSNKTTNKQAKVVRDAGIKTAIRAKQKRDYEKRNPGLFKKAANVANAMWNWVPGPRGAAAAPVENQNPEVCDPANMSKECFDAWYEEDMAEQKKQKEAELAKKEEVRVRKYGPKGPYHELARKRVNDRHKAWDILVPKRLGRVAYDEVPTKDKMLRAYRRQQWHDYLRAMTHWRANGGRGSKPVHPAGIGYPTRGERPEFENFKDRPDKEDQIRQEERIIENEVFVNPGINPNDEPGEYDDLLKQDVQIEPDEQWVKWEDIDKYEAAHGPLDI